MVVPYAPGGGSDTIGRMVGLKLGEALGESFVIDNRPGAASMVATEIVAKSLPDGYTLILADVPHTINVSTYAHPTYDAIKDFAPVMLVGTAPQIMVANPSFAYSSLKELLALPRAQTEKIAMGTSGTGSSPHMTYELLRLRTGLTLNHIPYKGGGPATADALAGQIPLAFNAAPASMTYLRANRLKGLGITSAKRHPLVPNVPTFIEAGVPDFTVAHWYGVLAPAGTPPAIVAEVNGKLAVALTQRDMMDRVATLGAELVGGAPERLAVHLNAEIPKWRDVVRAANIKL